MRHVIMFWVEMDTIPDNQPQIAAIRLQDPGPIKIQIGYSECCLRVCCTPRYFAIRFWAHSYASETRTIKTKCVKELSQSALYIMREHAEYRPVSSNVSLSCDPSYRHLRAKQIPRSQGKWMLLCGMETLAFTMELSLVVMLIGYICTIWSSDDANAGKNTKTG